MARKLNDHMQPSKRTVLLVFGLLSLWMLMVYTGMRLPYLYTELAFSIRAFLLFPALLGLFVYFSMIHRWKGQSKTLYALRVRRLQTRREKLKGAALTAFGFLLIAGGFAWTSVAFPAWITQLFASKRYMHEYRINDITARSGAKWSAVFDLEMIGATGERVTLRLSRSRYEKSRWKSGDDICVIGRTWILGTVIDDATRYFDKCGIAALKGSDKIRE